MRIGEFIGTIELRERVVVGEGGSFNSLVWSSLDLFVRVENAENFYGNWYEEA